MAGLDWTCRSCRTRSIRTRARSLDLLPQAPAIAIVDSGVQSRSDFGRRLSPASASAPLHRLGTATPTATARWWPVSPPARATATPASRPTRRSSPSRRPTPTAQSRTSDVLAASDWILQHKDQYNIRVANFSLPVERRERSARPARQGRREALAERHRRRRRGRQLRGRRADSGVSRSRPANDPFVITVGASTQNGTATRRRLRRALVGLGLHAGRLPQAGARRPGPLHDRRRCRWTGDVLRATLRTASSRPATCGCRERPSRRRSSPVQPRDPRAASGLDAGSGQGRPDAAANYLP